MLFESCEKVAKRCASWGEATRRHAKSEEGLDTEENDVDIPASLSSGGAYDIVCCAVVGLMFPGLEARSHACQPRCVASDQKRLTLFIVFLRRLVYDCTVFKTSEVEHPYTTVGTTAYKHVHAVSAETDIEDFFIVRYQLRLSRKRGYIPYCTSGVDAGSNNETWRKCVPIQRSEWCSVFGRFGIRKKSKRC